MFSPRRLLPPILGLLLSVIPAAAQNKDPGYPKVNTAIAYEVDPTWPKRPDDMKWGAMPGVAVDAADNIYVFTRAKNPVQVYDASGKFLRSWGRDEIKDPHHIKIDPRGNVWVADIGYHIVRQFTPEGKLLKTLGTEGKAGRDETHLNMPTDMAFSAAGDVFVSDGYGNARVVHFNPEGKFVKAWGLLGSKPGEFSIVHAIASDSKGRLYVADRNNVRIQVFDPQGKLLDVWSNIVVPWGLCMTKDDELWVCGSSPMQWRESDRALGCPPKDQVLMRFNTEGKLLQLWTLPKGKDGLEQPGELNWVHCVAVDSKGNLYAGDIKGKRAQKFVRKAP
jgi:DNA-binding beta-propeller fold protein YncE